TVAVEGRAGSLGIPPVAAHQACAPHPDLADLAGSEPPPVLVHYADLHALLGTADGAELYFGRVLGARAGDARALGHGVTDDERHAEHLTHALDQLRGGRGGGGDADPQSG